jgi:hypothetical protein
MTREEFIDRNPIDAVLISKGVKLIGHGNNPKCLCPFHEDRNPSMSVNISEGWFRCHGCGEKGSVIDLIAKFEGKTGGQVLKEASGTVQEFRPKSNPPASEVEACYFYKSATGQEVYRVIRYKPKTFRQQRKDEAGKWVWGMEGVERILYRLPEVLKSETISLCEGEKDAENLSRLGFCGTCNVGGAGKWMDGYTETLRGKNVLIFGDNDDAGLKHVELVFESIAGKVKTARLIQVPKPHKDISDYIAAFKSDDDAKSAVEGLIADSTPFVGGVKLPLFSLAEMEAKYKEHVKNLATDSFNLGRWLPSLGRIRALVPGELAMIVGNTGIGKTALLSSLAMSNRILPTVMFQLELPPELVFERMVAFKSEMNCDEVEKAYAKGDELGQKVLEYHFPNIQICCQPGLTLEQIEQIIIRAELKMGVRPKLVMIDYVQLVSGKGENRRDKFSNIAEGMKVLAKSTRTVVFIASQISRPDSDSPEVGLHDAKETGSLENSCGLVMGAWRNQKDAQLMHLKVLKSTKGGAGLEIACNYNAAQMAITERAVV